MSPAVCLLQCMWSKIKNTKIEPDYWSARLIVSGVTLKCLELAGLQQ